MELESNEVILNTTGAQIAEREEVTGAFGLILAGVIDKIYEKANELGVADDPTVIKAADDLAERMLILGNGIRPKPKRTRLYKFNERLKDSYKLGIDAIDEYVEDKYRLSTMVERIGIDIQGNMVVNGLLTEKAKRQLAQLNQNNEDK